MKKITILAIITGFAMFMLTSCGGAGEPAAKEKETPKVEKEAEKAPEASLVEGQLALGKKIYDEKCIVCHMANAEGLKGAFPPLKNSDYLLADPVRGVAQVLNGSNEEMVVNGETYNAPMTPQVQTKEEAVAVINYVLKEFNGYTEDQFLTMDDVADVKINPIN
jgi:mono/diheme cytochrome c family protein